MELVERPDRANLLSLVNIWALCGILLVFASVYGFSFERGGLNSISGAESQAVEAVNETRNAVVNTQFALAYLLSVGCIVSLIKPVWRQVRRNPLIFSVLGWAILSVLWSDAPSSTVINSVRIGINLMLVVYLFERYSANDIQKIMILVGCVAAAGSILMVVVFPQYGLQMRNLEAFGAWQGIFGQKNLLGLELLVLLLPAFFVELKGVQAQRLRVAYIVTLLGLILMSQSVGAWVASVLCLSFIALLKVTARMRKTDATLVAVVISGVAVTGGLIVLANYDAMMYALGKDPTITGRTVLWSGLIHLALQRPVLGYGYVAFWHGLNGPTRYLALQMNWLSLAGAENGVLETGLELGIVGVLLYVAVFVRAVMNALFCLGRGASAAALWYTSILFYVVATNIEGGALLMPSNLACIVPFVAYLGLRREVQHLRESHLG